jgi:CheY-like chemotaxis protein
LKNYQILLIEDNEGDVILTQEALNEIKLPHNLYILNDGKAAIDFLSGLAPAIINQLPDLILLDINLSKKNGFEVLEFIKQRPFLRMIPVIMLTTSSAETDIKRSYESMANCYLIKPNEVKGYKDLILKMGEFWLNTVRLPHSKSIAR